MTTTSTTSGMPAHEPTHVSGLHAYSQSMGLRPKERLDIRASGEGTAHLSVVRHRGRIEDARPVLDLGSIELTPQPLLRGSYVLIPSALTLPKRISCEVWIRPLAVQGTTGLLSMGALQLYLETDARPICKFGNMVMRGDTLTLEKWHHVAFTHNGQAARLYVDGVLADETTGPTPEQHSSPTRLGALTNVAGEATAFYTGDMYAPTVCSRDISQDEIAQRWRSKAAAPVDTDCVAQWSFDGASAEPFRNLSGNGHNGQGINMPVLMIPGPARIEDSDWHSYDPLADPNFGHAARFFADAFTDCRWPVSMSWQIPDDLVPGQYAITVTNGEETKHVHFLVMPSQPSARLMCLSTTSTRVAYNFESFGDQAFDYGAYACHSGFASRGKLLGQRKPAGGWWHATTVNFELPFYAWLDDQGMPYDLYTEWELEDHPELLEHYDAVAIAGHSEYWTATLYDRLYEFRQRGGHLLLMTGNTAYWRVSRDDKNAVLEVRKHATIPTPGADCLTVNASAHVHQLDHRPGTTMRAAGYPEAELIAGMSCGMANPPHPGPRTHYEVLATQHPLFHAPRPVDTKQPFADGAAGYETDLSCRSSMEQLGEATMLCYPSREGNKQFTLADDFDRDVTILARAILPNSHVLNWDNHLSENDMWAEMLLWESPGHGMVFHAGSVLAAWVLQSDSNYAAFILNVFDYMGLPTKRKGGQDDS